MSRATTSSKELHILEAAKPLFGRFGFRKTTIDDIAQAAGLGKGTIYLYFKSKEEIFAAVVRRECEGLQERLRGLVERETTVEAKLRVYILERFRHIHELPSAGVSREAFLETRGAPELEPLRAELEAEESRRLGEIIESGIATGEVRTRNVPLVVAAIGAALLGIDSPWHIEERELSIEDKVSAIVELFVNGLRGQRAP